MSTTPASPPRPPSASWQRLPWILLGLVALTLLVLYVRGSWGSAELLNPGSVEQGPVSQIYHDPETGTCVRAAILLPAPPEEVWKLITAYGKYDEMFGYLRNVNIERPEGGGARIQGQALSSLGGWWDFDIVVTEKQNGTTWTAKWDQPGGSMRVNRGGWTVTPAPNSQTILALQLEAQVDNGPTFFLRNVFLDRLKRALLSAAAEMKSNGS